MALFKDKMVELGISDTVIASDAYLRGDIVVKGSIKVEGQVEGSINEAKIVTIGKNGKIKGDITCEKCIVYGSVQGNIIASSLVEVMSDSRVEGDIKSLKVTIEEGAFFNGKCIMDSIPEKDSKKEGL